MDTCNPMDVSCPEFTSDPSKRGNYYNNTWSLAAGAGCEVVVDATNEIARMVLDETTYLGIEPNEDM